MESWSNSISQWVHVVVIALIPEFIISQTREPLAAHSTNRSLHHALALDLWNKSYSTRKDQEEDPEIAPHPAILD